MQTIGAIGGVNIAVFGAALGVLYVIKGIMRVAGCISHVLFGFAIGLWEGTDCKSSHSVQNKSKSVSYRKMWSMIMTLIIILIIFAIICLVAGVKGKSSGDQKNSSGLPSVRHCPNCGAPLRPGAHECGYCGDCW